MLIDRGHMVKHYQQFICMSDEVKELQAPMSRLRSRLHDFRDVCTKLRDRAESDHRAIQSAKREGIIASTNFLEGASGRNATPASNAADALEVDLDYLDVLMSERDFEKAVDNILRLNQQVNDKRTLITIQARAAQKAAIDKRMSQLTAGLCRELGNPSLRRTESRYIIDLLIKLRQIERAKTIYLKNRSAWLKAKLRQLQMQKEVKDTVIELAQLYFGCIKTTHADFTKYFTEPRLLSSFVVWAKDETENFWENCRKHVVTVMNCSIMADCVESARKKCSDMLDRGHVSLIFHLDRLIHPDLCDEINDRLNQSADAVRNLVQEDVWDLSVVTPKDFTLDVGNVNNFDHWLPCNMTTSCAELTDKIHARMTDLQPLVKFVEVYPAMLTGLGGLIDEYVERLKDKYDMSIPDIADDAMPEAHLECLAMLQNFLYVTETLLPKLSAHLQKSFAGRPAASLNVRIETLEKQISRELFGIYALNRAALHLGMGPLEEYYSKFALRRLNLHRDWLLAHPNQSRGNPHPSGMGHAPEEPVGEDGAPNPAGDVAVEPKGGRWPGGALDMTMETFEMDNTTVSPGFIQLHSDMMKDLQILAKQLGASSARKVLQLMMVIILAELKSTIVEQKESSADGKMAIGRGGLQQLIVDITFFQQTGGELSTMELLTDSVKVMEYVKLQAEDVLGQGCVQNETGADWHEDWVQDVIAKSGVPMIDSVLEGLEEYDD